MARGKTRSTLSNASIANALEKSGGNMSAAADALGVNRSTICRRVQKNEALQEVVANAAETLVDVAESMLYKRVRDGDMTAIAYALNNSPAAKRRGWGPRQEVTGAQGDPLQIVIRYAND